jgi:predicted ATPase
VPWLPISDLLRSYCQIDSRDDYPAIREKVTTRLDALGPDLDAIRPAVLSLLDVAVDDSEWATLDPAQRRRATLDGVRQLLLRESQRQPVLLAFEDLHWIDSESQALLDALVEALPAKHLSISSTRF